MQASETPQTSQSTLTDNLRAKLNGVIRPIAAVINRLGISPDSITLIGVVGNLVGGVFLAKGNFLIGGLIILLMGPLDALDGAMARLRGEPPIFGAFLDSVSDRYSELLIFGGLLAHYLAQADSIMAGLVFIAASGSVMVSYTRARAEGLGVSVKGGILTRAERYLVLVPSLIFNYARVGIAIVAVLANATAFQRIYLVRRRTDTH